MTGRTAPEVAALLADPSRARPARDFPTGQENVDDAGLYAWWLDDAGRTVLSETYDTELPSLIYGGQAGASSARAGLERGATLRSRINGNHLRGNIRSSTFRKTLAASLFEALGLHLAGPSKLDPPSNEALSTWMRAHLSIATIACPGRSTLAELEHAVLAELDPPLNLMGMARTPVRTELKAKRARLARPS